jgi:hypothetical protein
MWDEYVNVINARHDHAALCKRIEEMGGDVSTFLNDNFEHEGVLAEIRKRIKSHPDVRLCLCLCHCALVSPHPPVVTASSPQGP